MSKEMWATTYRPKTFKEVSGQTDKVFLYHTLKFGRELPPVIILSGPSGIGKTTIARIAAASANCDGRQIGITAEPCGECTNCVAVANNTFPAVTEIDGATFSGADDMRDIKAQANVVIGGHLQVFVIDEAHSLSGQAWNVLLKLFEEPPAGVCFFLLTSEPHKIPLKIRTRAMRLEFGKVSPLKIRERLETICQNEGVVAEPQILEAIVDQADGSVRSAIMMLQQFSISAESFTNVLLRDQSLEILYAAMTNDRVKALTLLHDSYNRTGDFRSIIEMWAITMERVLFVKNNIPTFLSESKTKELEELAGIIKDSQWAAGMEVLAEWVTKAQSKAHLSFVLSLFMKAVHGSTRAVETVAVTKKDDIVDDAEMDALIEGLNLG